MQSNLTLMFFKNLKEIIESNDLLSKYQFLTDTYSKAGSKTFNESVLSKIDESSKQINEVQQDLIALFWYAPLHNFFKKSDIENITKSDLLNSSKIKPEEYPASIKLFNEIITSIKTILDVIQHFIKEFEQTLIVDDVDNNKNNDTLKSLRIYFNEKTSINTLDELEKYTRIWNNILSAFRKLAKEDELPIAVQFVDKYSLVLNIGVKTANAILKAILETLNTQKRLLEIRNLKQEIQNVELSNEAEFEKLLEEEVETIIDEHSAILTRDLMQSFDLDYLENQKIFDSIQISLKQILNFIDKGGKIDSKQIIKNDELNIMNKGIVKELIKITGLLEKRN